MIQAAPSPVMERAPILPSASLPVPGPKMAQQGSKTDASKANDAKLADTRAKSVAQDIKPTLGKPKLSETKAKLHAAVKVATDIKSMEQLCDEYNRDEDPKSQGKSASKRLLEQLGLKRTSAFKVARAVCAVATEKELEGTDTFGELSLENTAYVVNLIQPEAQSKLVPHLYPDNALALQEALGARFQSKETKELRTTIERLEKQLAESEKQRKEATPMEFTANSISTFLFSELGKPKCIQLYSSVEEALKSCQQKRRKKLNTKFSQGDVVVLRNGARGVFNKICRKYARVNMIKADGQVDMHRWWTVHDPESLRKEEGTERLAFPQQPQSKSKKKSKPANDEEDDDMTDEDEPQPGAPSSSSSSSSSSNIVAMPVDG